MEELKGISVIGRYDSREEIEKTALRELNKVVHTDNADYFFDGKEWKIFRLKKYITFKVLNRAHVTGRGYITVVHNPDMLPIDSDKSAICKGQFRLPIHGIERWMTLMTIPRVMSHWGLITYEETLGDEITIRMYPDEADVHI